MLIIGFLNTLFTVLFVIMICFSLILLKRFIWDGIIETEVYRKKREKEDSGYNYRLNYCAEKVKVRLNYSTVKMLIENESPYLKICNINDFTDVLFLKDEKENEKVIQLSWEDYKKIKKCLQNKRAYDKLVIEQEEQRLKNEERIRQEKADRINEIENLEFAKSVIESEKKRITDISEKEIKTAISTLKERSDKMGEYIDVSKIIEDAKKNAESEIVLQLEQSTESK